MDQTAQISKKTAIFAGFMFLIMGGLAFLVEMNIVGVILLVGLGIIGIVGGMRGTFEEKNKE